MKFGLNAGILVYPKNAEVGLYDILKVQADSIRLVKHYTKALESSANPYVDNWVKNPYTTGLSYSI